MLFSVVVDDDFDPIVGALCLCLLVDTFIAVVVVCLFEEDD